MIDDVIVDPANMQKIDLMVNSYGRETTVMGTPSFPLAVFHTDLSRNALGYINWHWNSELQFCIVVKGSVIFRMPDKEYELSAGEGIFINAGTIHSAKPASGRNGVYICVMADKKFFCTFKESVFERKYFVPFFESPALECVTFSENVQWQADILAKIKAVSNSQYNHQEGYELEIFSCLIAIWHLMFKNVKLHNPKHARRIRSNNLVNAILGYIMENYSKRITIDEIAGAVHSSASECCRIFKRELGETISHYMAGYRIEKSTELLINTPLSVSDIAFEMGFCSVSYYIQNFKALTGTTPLSYRSENAHHVKT